MTVNEIKQFLAQNDLDAYVVSHGNRFLGQDIKPNEHKLQYLCGFSGSAGMLVITPAAVYLLVDGRYELQAAREIDTRQITVVPQLPRLKNAVELAVGQKMMKIGFDAWCFSAGEVEAVRRRFRELQLVDAGDLVQIDDTAPVEILARPVEFAGLSREQKCGQLAEYLAQQQADYILLTAADSVAWLLNIYARDLPYTPVVRAYAVADKNGAVTLFADNLKTDLPLQNMAALEQFLQKAAGKTILYDAHLTPEKLVAAISRDSHRRQAADICQQWKAQKNPTELQGMINCHGRDGVALVKLLCWLEDNWPGQTELDVAAKLHELRAAQAHFVSESFATIAAFADNGAIVHYQPQAATNKTLEAGNLLLLDSGGQYLDGTTDVTRTIAIGEPTPEMIADFTQVLKAHIALAESVFPRGTSGNRLDALARAQMWRKYLDYKHGTGHGVACFGNVHEGPISISPTAFPYGFQPAMVVSDEPGVYKEGKYGIRIENLLYTRAAEANADYLEFVSLTKLPIDKRLIDKYLLSDGEQAWLNRYHQEVYNSVSPYLDEAEICWLKKACSPL